MFVDKDSKSASQPGQGCLFIDTGPPGLPPAELVKRAGNTASQMRPDVLSGHSVSMNIQP